MKSNDLQINFARNCFKMKEIAKFYFSHRRQLNINVGSPGKAYSTVQFLPFSDLRRYQQQ